MTFAVVACGDCRNYWIISWKQSQQKNEQAECPRCGLTGIGNHKVIETAEERSAARKLRTKRLKRRTDRRNEDTYSASEFGVEKEITDTIVSSESETGQDESVDSTPRTPLPSTTETEGPSSREQTEQKNSGFADWQDNTPRAFEHLVDSGSVKRKDKYSEQAASILGTVGQDERPTFNYDASTATNTTAELDDLVTLPIPDDAGVSLTTQHPASKALTLTGHDPISSIWEELITDPQIWKSFIAAAGYAATSRGYKEFDEILDAAEITDTPLTHAAIRFNLHQLLHRQAWRRVAEANLYLITQELGTGHSTVEDILATAKLFRFIHHPGRDRFLETPTISIEIKHDEFKQRTRNQRENICELITILSKTFDIRLVSTRVTQSYLREYHREDLPRVSEWPTAYTQNSRVDEALTALDVDGGPVTILRCLDNESGETLSYPELYSSIEKSEESVRAYISTLTDYGLIERFGSQSSRKFTLLDDGRDVLEAFAEQFGTQATIGDSIDRTPNSQRQKRASDSAKNSPGVRRPEAAVHSNGNGTAQPDRIENTDETGSKYCTAEMSVWTRDAIAACGSESGSITVVADGIQEVDSNSQFVSVDKSREEAIVSVHATTPLDYTVSNAVALSHPKLIDRVFDEQTLDAVLDDVPASVLRNARQIGYLTDDILADAGEFRDMLVQWGKDVAELTRRHRNNEYGGEEFDDAADILSEIMRHGHGLAGSIVHLLDVAGIDIIRDVRVPASLNSGKIEDLAKSMAHAVTIQSGYDEYNAHRQLYEPRPEYRENSSDVEVDAADPVGRYIGSMVVRGGSATRLEPVLAEELERLEPHEDAPEFRVPVKMRGVKRENVSIATRRVLKRKSLRTTEDAISVLHAVVDSPFRVTQALEQLHDSSESRDINSVEIRYALQHLQAENVLSEVPRSVGKIVMALLRATDPISQAELTERADVRGQTVRNHSDELIDTGLVRFDRKSSGAKEWRMMLSFDSERGRDILPTTYLQLSQNIVNGCGECECGGKSLAAMHKGNSGGVNDSCLLSEWEQVRVALADIDGSCEGTTYEILLGADVKQTAIGNAVDTEDDEISASDAKRPEERNDTEDESTGTDDTTTSDDEDKFDLSHVSIEGARDDLQP